MQQVSPSPTLDHTFKLYESPQKSFYTSKSLATLNTVIISYIEHFYAELFCGTLSNEELWCYS